MKQKIHFLKRWFQKRTFTGWLAYSLGLILLAHIFFTPVGWTVSAIDLAQQAAQLNQQGLALLDQGRSQLALSYLEEATRLYQEVGNPVAVSGSRLNQALALQALGLQLRACQTIVEVLSVSEELCSSFGQPFTSASMSEMLIAKSPVSSEIQAIGLKLLGLSLNKIGQLPQAQVVLNQAIQLNQSSSSSSLAQAKLLLGTNYRLQFAEARNQFLSSANPSLRTESIAAIGAKSKQALSQYQEVIQAAEQHEVEAIQAKLNFVDLATEFSAWIESSDSGGVDGFSGFVLAQAVPVQQYIKELSEPGKLDRLPIAQAIDAKINLAQALVKLQSQSNSLLLPTDIKLLETATTLLVDAVAQAKTIENNRSISYGYGSFAAILERQSAAEQEILQYYKTAIAYGQAAKAWDVIYQWQYGIAKIYESAGSTAQAIEGYEGALANLELTRANLVGIDPNIQFSFREEVEPIYRDYLKLLFAQPERDFSKIIQVNEALQIAELENYLRCGQLISDWRTINSPSMINQVEQIIYIIDLDEQTKVIIQSSGDNYKEYSIDSKSVQSVTENLLINLQSPNLAQTDPAILRSYTQDLYNLLLKPADDDNAMPTGGTVVFVMDSLLQNIPMGLLYDGSQYLIERYSIAVAPGSKIREPIALRLDQMKALIAGVSEKSPSFSAPLAPEDLTALPAVEAELQQVKKYIPNSVELLNQAFTVKRFGRKVDQSTSIVHISTHGQFSSDPSQTFLLSWDELLNANEINRLLKVSNGSGSIEMLVLSACQTAQGDRRSALGIAGIAAQSGIRSTVATLWTIDAESTAVLMNEFYANLKAGQSKSEALRQAQITLLKSDLFYHPYFWGAFILIGSWL